MRKRWWMPHDKRWPNLQLYTTMEWRKMSSNCYCYWIQAVQKISLTNCHSLRYWWASKINALITVKTMPFVNLIISKIPNVHASVNGQDISAVFHLHVLIFAEIARQEAQLMNASEFNASGFLIHWSQILWNSYNCLVRFLKMRRWHNKSLQYLAIWLSTSFWW